MYDTPSVAFGDTHPSRGGQVTTSLSPLGKVAECNEAERVSPHTDPERSERGVYPERKSIMKAIR